MFKIFKTSAFVYYFYLGLFCFFNISTADPTPPSWLVGEVAQEFQGRTTVIIGRINKESLIILNDQLKWKTYKIPSNSNLESNYDNETTSTKDMKTVSGAVTKSFSYLTHSLNYTLPVRDIKNCENTREFKTFLSQIGLFKNMLFDMEVTSSSKKFAHCASLITQIIAAKGFQIQLVFGDLVEGGGIQVRGYLSPQRQPIVTKKDTEIVSLYAQISTFRKIPISISNDGYFLFSFNQPIKNINLILENASQSLLNIPIAALPSLPLGESPLEGFGTNSIIIKKGVRDSFRLEEVPVSVIQGALEEELKFRNQYRLKLANQVSLRTVSGTGLLKEKQSHLLPFDLFVNYILDSNFEADLRFTPEISMFTKNSVKSMFVSAGLKYSVYGEPKRHFKPGSPLHFQAGLSGFYIQNRGETARPESVYLLSDFIGISIASELGYQINPQWSSSIKIDYTPMPDTPSTRATLSNSWSLDIERCWTFDNCIGAGFADTNYGIEYKDLGLIQFKTLDWFISYRRRIR